MKFICKALALTMALSGCASTKVKTVCAPKIEWPTAMQKQAASELDAVPLSETSAIRGSLKILTRQRQIIDACRPPQ